MREFGKVIICVIIGCLLFKVNSYAVTQPAITVSGNTSPVVVGGVFKLEITVTADKGTVISWDLCDELFKNSAQFMLLSISSPPSPEGTFKHDILFTTVKPVHMPISSLPLLINKQKVATPGFKINFVADRKPLKLNDLKPNESASWKFTFKAIALNGLLLLMLLIVIGASYVYLKKWVNNRVPLTIKKSCLKKLETLERAGESENVNAAVLINQISDLLREYLRLDMLVLGVDDESKVGKEFKTKFDSLISTANEIKFLPGPAVRLLYPEFISEIRDFITNYQPVTIR
jgi:hypothetical protein